MSFLFALAALAFAQYLPGLLVVKLLDVGRDREERYVMAAVLGGPVAALVYWIVLLADWSPLFWILLVNVAAAAVIPPATSPLKPDPRIIGIVKLPVVTALATALPESEPIKPLPNTATLAGPPGLLPNSRSEKSIIN